jgi:hypothetical protein
MIRTVIRLSRTGPSVSIAPGSFAATQTRPMVKTRTDVNASQPHRRARVSSRRVITAIGMCRRRCGDT